MTNRLARATSPYLLQHAGNPVEWFEWGEEVFTEARRRDVPLLISVGYAACHWCHVMAHESFEDQATAALMNTHFVNVKVDREERPDVDAVYMAATQAMTGRGGWPMTVLATPDGEPFYAGTYFPPRPAHGLPSFTQVLGAVVEAWTQRPGEVRAGAARLRDLLAARPAAPAGDAGGLGEESLARAVVALGREFDGARGGFGAAPKFPPSMLLEWLLRHHARTGSAQALTMAERTLEAMARGGMYDQVGGGFARYSVDAGWVVPHFEKMLSDNALLLRVYAHWWRATGSPLARRITEETAAFLLRDLRTPEGGFASSLDADSLPPGALPGAHPEEGAFYVWTPGGLRDVLGEDDGAWAASVFSVTEAGTFEGGASVLQRLEDPADGARLASVRARLLAARAGRPAPGRDDKMVTAWNGLAVAALADAGAILDRPDWVAAAEETADLVDRLHTGRSPVGGVRLVRASRDGVAGAVPGVLEDYADLAEGMLALHSATGRTHDAEVAGGLLRTVLESFGDGRGAFFDTAAEQTDPVLARLGRPQDLGDGPTPSGTAAAAGALVTYAAVTGSDQHREAAERSVAALAPVAERFPRAAGWVLAVAEALADGPREVAVVGSAGDPRFEALRRVAVLGTAPGAVVGLRAGRDLVGGAPAAYVCRRFVCEQPVTEPEALATLVGVRGAPPDSKVRPGPASPRG